MTREVRATMAALTLMEISQFDIILQQQKRLEGKIQFLGCIFIYPCIVTSRGWYRHWGRFAFGSFDRLKRIVWEERGGQQTKHWLVHWQRGAIPTWAAETKFPCLSLHRLAISNGLLEKTKAAHIFSLMLKSETHTMKYIFVSWAYLWQVAKKRSSS